MYVERGTPAGRCRRTSKPGAARLAWLACAIALAVVLAPTAAQAADAPGVKPEVVVLDNGLQLLLVERHEQPAVSAGVFYNVGAVNDPAGQSGMAHFFEHMMFKGSKIVGTSNYEAEKELMRAQNAIRDMMRDEMIRMRELKRHGKLTDVLDPNQWTDDYKKLKKQYDELLAQQREFVKNNELANLYSSNGGAMVNAGTAKDVTVYFVQLPANKIELFFWLESDRMANCVMREFYIERDNVREERRLTTESTPTGKFDEAFDALFWQSHPYGQPVLGWASEVESIPRSDVEEFYAAHYVPNNATVVLVGDFKTEEMVAKAKQYFGRIPRGTVEPTPVVTEELEPVAHRRFYAEADTNPIVRLRFHTVALGHTDEAALDALGALLSGKSGRLYKRLVTEEDAVIGIPRANNNGMKYAGYFEIYATVKEGREPEEVELLILDELGKLQSGEIDEYEMQKVKNQVYAQSVRQLRSNLGLMFQLGLYETWVDWDYINTSTQRLLEVTTADVKHVLNKYFDPDLRTSAIYRTKPGSGAPGDPELDKILAGMPPQAQAGFRAQIQRLNQVDDLKQLEQYTQQIRAALQSPQMPEEQRAPAEYMLKIIEARAAEVAASQEGE
jgi:predicted Zn-dependent peptidase